VGRGSRTDHTEMCRLFDASGAAMGKRLHAVVERA
jgi:hypothetical protein